MSTGVRAILFISLALNLLIVGGLVGARIAGVRFERAVQGAIVDRMPGPRAFMQALPQETRAKVRAQMVQSFQESRRMREAARQARVDAFNAVAAEPYDVERVKQAFARLRAADQAAVGVFHDNIAVAFGAMSREERAAALEALRNAQPARSQRRRERGAAPPPQ